MDLLGSPVEIHLASGERESVRLELGGRSGVMLTERGAGEQRSAWARAAVAAAADAAAASQRSLFLGQTAEMWCRGQPAPASRQTRHNRCFRSVFSK